MVKKSEILRYKVEQGIECVVVSTIRLKKITGISLKRIVSRIAIVFGITW